MDTEQKVGKILGELESDVMEIIWQSKGPISVRTVTQNIQKKRQIAYTTVMTVMGRLVEKGLLKCKKEDKAYTYQPAYSKDRFLTRVSRQIIKNFIASFGETAVAHFAEEVNRLTPTKRKELKKLLKEAQK